MKKKWLSAAIAASLGIAARRNRRPARHRHRPSRPGTERCQRAPPAPSAASEAPGGRLPGGDRHRHRRHRGHDHDRHARRPVRERSLRSSPRSSPPRRSTGTPSTATAGIAGRQVELIIEDNAYDVPTHLEKYEVIRDQVAIISQSTGSPHTAAIAAQPRRGQPRRHPVDVVLGLARPRVRRRTCSRRYTTYCVESMNGIEWLHNNRDVQTVALISFPGEYGGDGDAGARMAIEAARPGDRLRRRRPGDPAVGGQPEPGLERRHPADRRRPTPTSCGRRSTRQRWRRDHGRRDRPGLRRAVVGQLADVQLQAARHRAGAAARPVLHRLDVHR